MESGARIRRRSPNALSPHVSFNANTSRRMRAHIFIRVFNAACAVPFFSSFFLPPPPLPLSLLSPSLPFSRGHKGKARTFSCRFKTCILVQLHLDCYIQSCVYVCIKSHRMSATVSSREVLHTLISMQVIRADY